MSVDSPEPSLALGVLQSPSTVLTGRRGWAQTQPQAVRAEGLQALISPGLHFAETKKAEAQSVCVFTAQFSSVQFSHSVRSDSLRPHESQHARPPCPSPTPGVHSDSRHQVSDAIQPSHPLPSPSPPAPNPSQHQSCSVVSNSLRPHGL